MEYRFLNLTAAFLIFAAVASTTSAQSQEDVTKGQAVFNSGTIMVSKGDFAGAIQKFTEVMSILPTWHLPYLNRGVARLSLLQLAEAEADADKALSLIRPGTSTTKLHSGIAYQIKGTVKQHLKDYKASLDFFSLALEFVPSDAKFHNSRGTAFRLLDRNNEAFVSYSKAIELDPMMAGFYVNRASISERLKDNEAALRDLDEALRLDKNLGSAYYTRAAIRMRSKAFPEALADFDEAIRFEPNKSAYFHARGLVHHSTRQFDLAIKDHTQAIALDPKNSHALSDRAIAFGNLGNTKAAIEDLKKAISFNAESSALRYNLSFFLFRSGQFSESVEAATLAISRSPNWRAPYILRSNGYVKLGTTAKASDDRVKAESLNANGKPHNDKHFIFDLEVLVPEEPKP